MEPLTNTSPSRPPHKGAAFIDRFFQSPYIHYLSQLALYGCQKLIGWLGPRLQSADPASQTAPPSALSIEKHYKVEMGRPDRVAILLVGCGGTGGFAAHIIAQFAVWASQNGIDIRLYFVDPDKVEDKNLVRQNFCKAEVGYEKAITLAWRFSAAFGLTITPIVDCFSATLLERVRPTGAANGSLTVVIGAVDNFQARRDIADAVTRWINGRKGTSSRDKICWIDAGNHRLSGHVLFGNSLDPEPSLSPLGFCTGVPLPHIQAPSILQPREPQTDLDALSCAELGILEEQSAMINRFQASLIGLYLYRLFQGRDLDMMATYINLKTGSARSLPISQGKLVMPPAPPRPQLHRVPVRREPEEPDLADEAAPPQATNCPVCSSDVIAGQDHDRGILVAVRFCTACTWREEGCPECGHDYEEAQVEAEAAGQTVPGLACTHCNWRQPIPEAYRMQPVVEP
jgi:PRTRC genetic system ThiF family protein